MIAIIIILATVTVIAIVGWLLFVGIHSIYRKQIILYDSLTERYYRQTKLLTEYHSELQRYKSPAEMQAWLSKWGHR